MRLQYTTLQCSFTALIGAIFLLVVASDSIVHATNSIPDGSETEDSPNFRRAVMGDGGSPLALDSFNGLEIRDGTTEDGELNELELVRRYPADAKSLGNNQFQESNIHLGDVHWWYMPKKEVHGKKGIPTTRLPAYLDPDNLGDSGHELRKRDESSKKTTTVYLSLTTCRKPSTKHNHHDQDLPRQLDVYVSTSEKVQKPGPGNDDQIQTMTRARHGYAGFTVEADSDVFIGVAAPNSTSHSGSYKYQIAASIDAFFHSVVEDESLLYFVDADVSAALLVTNNLTQSEPSSENYQQWMNITPPYTMFAHNNSSSTLRGLERSFCALDKLAQVGQNNHSVEVGMTRRGLGNKPKQQFYLTGLKSNSWYSGTLALVNNSTKPLNGVIGGGGRVWKPINFATKFEDNCAILFNLTFCSEVAYAVPARPDLKMDHLRSIYDDNAKALYKNFTYSLQQVQCKTNQEAMFSLAVDCDDCANAYKQWLCSVSIPRCADFGNNKPYLAVRNAGQKFLNGSSLPADNKYRQSPIWNQSRNSLIDTEIKPGPYKEVLPCQDICYNLVKNCPSALGFGCPTGSWLNASYGYRNAEGDITCSYLGAAYYLNGGSRVYSMGGGLGLVAIWIVLWVVI